MTAGQDALIEAMRIEQARIYGQLQHEHRNTDLCAHDSLCEQDPPSSNVTRLAAPRRKDVA